MIAEGIVTLIWAAAGSYFFVETDKGKATFATEANAEVVVNAITKEWLGTLGASLAIFGVIAAPITSGDTAFRSARLIVADFLNYDQKPIRKRLYVAIPLFIAGAIILIYSLVDKNGFDIIWRYFAWTNQTLAAITLWVITIYLFQKKKLYLIALIPALFMTMVVVTYIAVAPEGFRLPHTAGYLVGGMLTLFIFICFISWARKISSKATRI